jgi:hypothetical protein
VSAVRVQAEQDLDHRCPGHVFGLDERVDLPALLPRRGHPQRVPHHGAGVGGRRLPVHDGFHQAPLAGVRRVLAREQRVVEQAAAHPAFAGDAFEPLVVLLQDAAGELRRGQQVEPRRSDAEECDVAVAARDRRHHPGRVTPEPDEVADHPERARPGRPVHDWNAGADEVRSRPRGTRITADTIRAFRITWCRP